MSQIRPITQKSANRPLALFLAAIGTSALCSGCFVIRHEQFSRPVGPVESVEFHRIAEGFETYSRVVDTTGLKMEVSVANYPSGWELQFLFNLIPISRYHYGKTEPLSVDVEVEPKTPGLTLQPGKIFFVCANKVRLPPAKARYGLSPEASLGDTVSITNRMTFHLEFPVEHRAYPEQDVPFQLSIEGLRVASRVIAVPPLTFEPQRLTRPAFRLPY